MIAIEEDLILEKKQNLEFPGLITESLRCQCYLHGFEIDLEGNVIVPRLVMDQADEHLCKVTSNDYVLNVY